MKLKPVNLPLIILLFATLIAVSAVTVTAGPGDPVHNLNKGTSYTTIAAAVADAGEDDTIQVDSGTYLENNIDITKPITLIGNGPTNPEINGAGFNGITVSANYVQICGINVTNCYQGITVNANYVSINDSNIYDCDLGIYLDYSDDNEIWNCSVTDCSNTGIYLNYAGDNYIHDNDLMFNNMGLLLKAASYNTIVGNNIIGNTNLGIQFLYGDEHYNVFYLNTFLENDQDVEYNYDNLWNSEYELSYQYIGVTYTNYVGNYWDRYTGLDSDNDGIGDTPMIVFRGDGSDILDNYPMIMEITLPPKASFTANATCNYAPFAVKFTDTSANEPTEWHWEFGDGATSDLQNPVHIYTTPGTYLVNLTVSNDAGSETARMADTGKLMLALNPLPSPLKAEWLKTYPMTGVSGSYMYDVVDDSNGGFALAGYTSGANTGLRLTSADADGNLAWNQIYDTYGFGMGCSMVAEADGGYTVAGESASGYLTVTRISPEGSVVWTETFGDTNGNSPGIAHTADGGYVVTGSQSFYRDFRTWGSADYMWTPNVFIAKLDSEGTPAWGKTLGNFVTNLGWQTFYSSSAGHAVEETADGGFIIAGTLDIIGRGSDLYMLKTDSSGNFVWNTTYGVLGNGENGNAILPAGDGNYLVAGSAVTENADGDPVSNVLLVKVAPDGSLLWDRMYRGSDDQRMGDSLIPLDDGFAIAGQVLTPDEYRRPYLLGVDENGNRNWEAILNFSILDYLSITPAGDGFVIGGSTRANDEANYEAFMMKIGTPTVPTVTGTTPASGATNVSIRSCVNATFSTDMDSGSLLAGFTLADSNNWPVSGTVMVKDNVAAFIPDYPLERNMTYQAKLAASVQDTDDRTLGSDYVWSFTTAKLEPLVLWTYQTSGAFTPVVSDGIVYTADNSGNVYALFAGNGTRLWDYDTGEEINMAPTVADGVVYSGSWNIHALDADTGSQRWSTGVDGYITTPTVADGVVYLSSGGNNGDCLRAYDVNDGHQIWEYTIYGSGGQEYSTPVVANGIVYAGSSDGRLYALHANDGDLAWNFPTDRRVYSSPAVADGNVIFGSGNGYIYALNAATGAQLWKVSPGGEEYPDPVYSKPLVADGVVYIGGGDEYVYALDESTGSTLWSFRRNIGSGSLALEDGLLYLVGDADGNVTALDAATGRLIWNLPTGDWATSSPAAAGGVAFVGGADGKIYAIGPMISSLYPADGAIDVTADSVRASFDVAMDQATLTSGFYVMDSHGDLVSGHLSYQDQTITFTPESPLMPGATYTATLAGIVGSQAGSTLISDFSWSFTVSANMNQPVKNQRTGQTFAAIQAAIDAALSGDTILVDSGTYVENVNIDKRLNLTGVNTGAGMPKVDGSGYDYAIYVGADGSTVTGFNVANADAGIEVGANRVNVSGNMAVGCSECGIILDSATNHNNVTYNTVRDCDDGIMLSSSASYNNVTGNTATGNAYGIRLYYGSGTIPVYNNITDNDLDLNEVGIGLRNVNNNNITGNVISGCDYSGIEFTSSSYNNLTGNVITASAGGIYTYSSYENTFAANSLSGNTNGITLESSNGILTGNVLSGNNVGIYLKYCTDTVLWLNRLSNTLNFKIDGTGTNYWNSTTLRGYYYNGNHFVSYVGNYWSDYSGPDSNSNGIIDTARTLASGNVDRFPVLLAFPAITTPAVVLPVLEFSAASATADEGTTAHIMLHRTGDTSGMCSVWVSNNGGTAVAGTNYTFIPLRITFEPDQADSGFDVKLLTDSVIETTDAFVNFSLSDPIDAVLGSQTKCNLTIHDTTIPPDTTAPVTTFTWSSTSGSNGWNISDFFVFLDAVDTGSGVARIAYQFDGGAWDIIDDPTDSHVSFEVISNGIHTLKFNSTDAAGNREADQTATFKIDKTLPAVISTTPFDGAGGVSCTAPAIAATFNENIDASSTAVMFTVTDEAGRSIPGSVAYDETTKTMRFTSSETLSSATKYTARISGVTDFAGNAMATEKTWTFTTIVAQSGDYDCQILLVDAPAVMTFGNMYKINVTVRNTGSQNWNVINYVRTATDLYWGEFVPNILIDSIDGNQVASGLLIYRTSLNKTDSGIVTPGDVVNYTMDVTPSSRSFGNWETRFNVQMVKSYTYKGYFGEAYGLTIGNGGTHYDCEFIGDTAPERMLTGQYYHFNVTVKNTGNANWNVVIDKLRQLGKDFIPKIVQGTGGLKIWDTDVNKTMYPVDPKNYPGLYYVTVLPGDVINYTFNVSVSDDFGVWDNNRYVMRMCGDSISKSYFGPAYDLVIDNDGRYFDCQYLGIVDPSPMRLGDDYIINLTVKNTGTLPWTVVDYYFGQQSMFIPVMSYLGDGITTTRIMPSSIRANKSVVAPGEVVNYTYSVQPFAYGYMSDYEQQYSFAMKGRITGFTQDGKYWLADGYFGTNFTTTFDLVECEPTSIVAVSPARDAMDVPVSTSISVTFSNPVTMVGLDSQGRENWGFTVYGEGDDQPVSGGATYDDDTNTLTFSKPYWEYLEPSKKYTASVSGLKGKGGLYAESITWSFWTSAVVPPTDYPHVLGTIPNQTTEVRTLKPDIYVYFDKRLDPTSLSGIRLSIGLSDIPVTVEYIDSGAGPGSAFPGSASMVKISPSVSLSCGNSYNINLWMVRGLDGAYIPSTIAGSFNTPGNLVIIPSPADGQTDVSPNQVIKLRFSRELDPTSLAGHITLSEGYTPIAASLDYGTNELDTYKGWVTITPAGGLQKSKAYTIHVSGIRDAWGITMDREFLCTFYTEGPMVLYTTPPDGAMDQPTSTLITATFSDPMDERTVISGFSVVQFNGGTVPGTVTYDAAIRKATFRPSGELNAFGNMYTVTLSGMVSTQSGPMPDYTWNFRTLWRKPTVVSTAPADDDTRVSPNASISVTFSENMDPEAARTGFKLRDYMNNGVAGSVVTSGNTVTFTPSAPLNSGEHYTVYLHGLKGLQLNTMPDYAFAFTVMHKIEAIPTSDLHGTPRPSLIPTATPMPFQTTLNGVGVTINGDRITAPAGTDISRFLTDGSVTIPAGGGKLTVDIDVGLPKNTGTITGVHVSDQSSGTASGGAATVSVTADLDGLPSGSVTFSATVSDPTPEDIRAAREWIGGRSRSLINALALIDVSKSGFTNDDIVEGTAKITLTVKKPLGFSRTKTYTVIRHGDNGYEELTATYKSETADTVTFEIVSPNGFSTFLLAETAAASTPVPTTMTPPPSATPVPGPAFLSIGLAVLAGAMIMVRVRKK